jgi:hypothetical protein
MNKKFQTSGLSRIEIPQPDGSVKTCVTKEAIEDGCTDKTFLKYSQTKKTPPMTSPLLDNIGFLADTIQAQQILDGTYKPSSETDPYMKKNLNEL